MQYVKRRWRGAGHMDDDLGDVLRNLNRSTCEARRQLANHPLTRSYLEAGIRLLEEEFFAKAADDGRPEPRSFLWMSRDQVVNEVANGPSDLPQRGNPGSLRDRWPYFSDYLGDLIRYALRPYTWSDQIDLAEQTADAIGEAPASTVFHEITYRKLVLFVGETATRFPAFVTAFADRDPVVAEALSASYREVAAAWRAVYANFFHTWGVRLRPGLSLDDLMILMGSVADGLTLRLNGDPTAPVLDNQQRRSLLGTAAMALVIALIDPGDGETLEEAFNRMADPDSRSDVGPT